MVTVVYLGHVHIEKYDIRQGRTTPTHIIFIHSTNVESIVLLQKSVE